MLTLPLPRRLRDKPHLQFVAKQPCLVCGRQPCDAHHLRFAQSRGLGLKVSDEFTVPLCRAHHRELHQSGKEVEWWARKSIEPIGIAGQVLARDPPAAGQSDPPEVARPATEPCALDNDHAISQFEAGAANTNGETNPVAGFADMTSLRQINQTAATPRKAPAQKLTTESPVLPEVPYVTA